MLDVLVRYLHEVRKPAVVHKNVTSSNILLSEELEPHLSGCWMQALLPDSEFEVGANGYHTLTLQTKCHNKQNIMCKAQYDALPVVYKCNNLNLQNKLKSEKNWLEGS